MQVIGQETNLEIINSWNKMPQFTIIQGDRNTGKTHLVLYMCSKFKLQYKLMGNSVNDVRELVNAMAPNSNTVYHFKDFDKASLQAKNSLLKITEEPVVGNYIVITGNTQIKTLESRARKLVMSAYKMEDMCEYMKSYFETDEAMLPELYKVGINTPPKIKLYSKYTAVVELASFTSDVFNKITAITPNDFIPIMNSFESKYEEIDGCELFLNMLIHKIEYNILTTNIYDYYEILNVLISAKESLERTKSLNRKFVIYKVLYILNSMRGVI